MGADSPAKNTPNTSKIGVLGNVYLLALDNTKS